MGFAEESFPVVAEWGTSGGPEYETAVVELDSQQEERTMRRAVARKRFEIVKEITIPADIATLRTFFEARGGRQNGFLFDDLTENTTASDHTSAAAYTDVQIGVGNGSTKTFQLLKKYSTTSLTRYKNVKKPKTGTVLVGVNGVQKTLGVDFTVDVTTGIVTFGTAPTAGHPVTAGCGFNTPVRFDMDLLEIVVESYGHRAIRSCPLIEEVDPGAEPGEFFFGGAYDLGELPASPTAVTLLTGRVLTFTCNVADRKVLLPDISTIPAGAPVLILQNKGTQQAKIRDYADSLDVVTLPGSGASVEMIVGHDSSQSKVWIGLS